MPTRTRNLPPDVADLLTREKGIVTAAVAGAAGVHKSRLFRLERAGLLTRLAPGCYAARKQFSEATAWQQFRLRSCAFAASRGPRVFLTGWSAAVTWGLPTMGAPPAVPQAIRSSAVRSGAERTAYGVIRAAHIPLGQARRINRVGVMSREWAVADVARSSPIPYALVVADAAAREGADLHTAAAHMTGRVGANRARWVAEHADPLAESPIETLGRFTCIEFDLPMPVSNAWVGAERPEFRVDGLWPFHYAAAEADGAVKYDNRPDASRIVNEQTEREWRLRRLGLDIARFTWHVAAHDRPQLAARFTTLLRDNPLRTHPLRWWKHVPGAGPVEPVPDDWPSAHPAHVTLPAGWNH